MTYHFDDDYETVPAKPQYLPCGGVAYYDSNSTCHSWRCECGAVVGSIGQPQHCKDEAQKYTNWESLGGKGWDYFEEKDNVK